MECDIAREAISARIDGEDPGVPDDALAAHLRTCADCRGWRERAHAVTRKARLGAPFLDHDLTATVLAEVPPVTLRTRRRVSLRVALALLSVAQLAITVPLLILGHDTGAGTHAAHELGSFDLALAIAFAVGAIRPSLSAGLAWPCSIAAAGLVGTAVLDLIGGQTIGADEAQHLIAAAGSVLLFWQARTLGAGTADPGAVPQRPRADWQPDLDADLGNEAAPGARVSRPGGDDAARADGPEVAAGAPRREAAA